MNVDITSIIEEYGILGILFIVLLITLVSLIEKKWINDIISSISENFVIFFMKFQTSNINKERKNITDSDVLNHDIFGYIDYWMFSRIPILKFKTEYRTAILRKYLTIYLHSYKEKIYEFISDGKYKDMKQACLKKSLLTLINDIIFDYENEAMKSGLPMILINKMKTKNQEKISLTIDLIEGICDSRFYSSPNNLLKIYSVLNIILSILEHIISNAEMVCNSINGDLKGLTYNGKTEP